MNDMGTANVDAEEMRQLFEGFAAVSTALENFYGKDVSSKVTESLSKASMENWGKNGLMNYAMNAEQAFQIAFTDIIKHAAATGDAVAVADVLRGGELARDPGRHGQPDRARDAGGKGRGGHG